MNLFEKSAYELYLMLREKKVSASEICKDTFKRIKNTDEKINSFLSLNEENCIKKAKEIDEKLNKGEKLSLLAGIPISIKDNISIKGLRNTCASKMLENYTSEYDASIIKSIKENDMLIVGKTNLDEFAMGSSTETSYFKKTKNPYDLERVPGGSSGGCASSVSSGQVPISIGSDTGGSIRQPASYCGVLGLKPTYGSVSRYGIIAYASTLDQIGPLARTTKDLAMIFSKLAFKDKMDMTTVSTDFNDYESLLNQDIKNLKIGVPKEYFLEGVDKTVKEKVYKCIKILEKNGAIIKNVSLPLTENALSAYYVISCSEASSNFSRFDGVRYGYRDEKAKNIKDLIINSRTNGFGDEVKRRILLGTYFLSSENTENYYKNALYFRKKITNSYIEIFKECDFLITPTVPNTAFKLGSKANPIEMYMQDICTVSVNICGLPAISLPCDFDDKGLPIGIQLIGNMFSEKRMLSVANFIEMLYGGFNKIPNF